MSGFLLHRAAPGFAPVPLSLGRSPHRGEHVQNGFRLAVAASADPQAQFHAVADGTLWLAGDASPAPRADRALAQWLDACDGSFRGVFFPREGAHVELVSDPYGSRALYYALDGDRPCAADKVASLAAVLPPAARTLAWGVLAEALAMGCVLSTDTALCGVVQVEAGCRVRLQAGAAPRVTRYRAAPDADVAPAGRSLYGDARALASAVAAGVRERWSDRAAPLLLSGGYDSRWVLHLAGPGRRSVTVAPAECRELAAARRIAATCGATHETRWYGVEKWVVAARDGYLLTGGLFNPLKCHFLHDAAAWAGQGVQAVAHAFLFDTVMKASPYFVFDTTQFRSIDPAVLPERPYMNAATAFAESYLRELLATLSREGRAVLGERLRDFDATTATMQVDGFEFGIEKRVLHLVSRQLDTPLALGLLEHVEVQAPIFHRDIWQWWRESDPRHRKPCTAYLLGLLLHGGRVAWQPKGDTGIRPATSLARSLLRGWVPSAVRARRHGPSGGATGSASVGVTPWTRSAWGVELTREALAQPAMRSLLAERLAALRDVPIFSAEAIDRRVREAETGEGDPHLLTCLAAQGALRLGMQDPARMLR